MPGLDELRVAYDSLYAASSALPQQERPIAYLANECACVKRRGGFILRLDNRRFQKRGHKNKGGMRGGDLPATQVCPPLKSGSFNFLKVSPREQLGLAVLARRAYRVIVNKWPIYSRHIMLVSEELRPQVRQP